MKILTSETSDVDLLTYVMTMLNNMLTRIPDMDTYYDVTDSLEEQGMQDLVKKWIDKKSDDALVEQMKLYEVRDFYFFIQLPSSWEEAVSWCHILDERKKLIIQ